MSAAIEAGEPAILEFGRDAIRLGGSPLAELTVVGRRPVKRRSSWLSELCDHPRGRQNEIASRSGFEPWTRTSSFRLGANLLEVKFLAPLVQSLIVAMGSSRRVADVDDAA